MINLENLVPIIEKAGKAVLLTYNTDFNYELKNDNSPLTEADKLSHQILKDELNSISPDIPIISEEDSELDLSIRKKWDKFWLIDPLDGTKEFIKKNGEFTVNIALMENNYPTIGLIHLPLSKETFFGTHEKGSFHLKDNNLEKIHTKQTINDGKIRIVVSRSHLDEMTLNNIELIRNKFDVKTISVGSSIKFCVIASGKADIYLRFGPTSEWDIAAGEAILKNAGGTMTKLDGCPISYNDKENHLNPSFIAAKNATLAKNILNIINQD